MAFKWGYSPKSVKYIPLGEFPANKYLIIAQQAIENLGWKLSHLSESGIIAYTGLSFQSYSEEISIRIVSNMAVFKSECIGIQLLFTDYGKNDLNTEKFFDEFEYVEFHLKDIWQEKLDRFQEHITIHDDGYFNLAPLRAKDKIKNVLYLFYPQKYYAVTPVIVLLNVVYWLFMIAYVVAMVSLRGPGTYPLEIINKTYEVFGANSRSLVLSGDIWRLVSYQFMHMGFSHLFFNMYSLIYLGLMIENKLGTGKTVAVYFLSGICGGVLSICTHEMGFMIGASGSIMGMFGAFLALLISNAFEKNANKALLISTMILVTYTLINGLTSKIVDNGAHLGGLVSGFIIGYLLFNSELFNIKVSIYARASMVGVLVLAFGAAALAYVPLYQTLEYKKLQYEYNKNDADFNAHIYYIEDSFSKEKKLSMVKEYGIDLWKKNLKITAEMRKLKLREKEAVDRKYKTMIAVKAYHATMLMYKDYKSGNTNNRPAIVEEIDNTNFLRQKLIGILTEMDTKAN